MSKKLEQSTFGFRREESFWEATRYGKLIERHDISCDRTLVTIKIYFYENEYIQEVWNNGIRVHASKVID